MADEDIFEAPIGANDHMEVDEELPPTAEHVESVDPEQEEALRRFYGQNFFNDDYGEEIDEDPVHLSAKKVSEKVQEKLQAARAPRTKDATNILDPRTNPSFFEMNKTNMADLWTADTQAHFRALGHSPVQIAALYKDVKTIVDERCRDYKYKSKLLQLRGVLDSEYQKTLLDEFLKDFRLRDHDDRLPVWHTTWVRNFHNALDFVLTSESDVIVYFHQFTNTADVDKLQNNYIMASLAWVLARSIECTRFVSRVVIAANCNKTSDDSEVREALNPYVNEDFARWHAHYSQDYIARHPRTDYKDDHQRWSKIQLYPSFKEALQFKTAQEVHSRPSKHTVICCVSPVSPGSMLMWDPSTINLVLPADQPVPPLTWITKYAWEKRDATTTQTQQVKVADFETERDENTLQVWCTQPAFEWLKLIPQVPQFESVLKLADARDGDDAPVHYSNVKLGFRSTKL